MTHPPTRRGVLGRIAGGLVATVLTSSACAGGNSESSTPTPTATDAAASSAPTTAERDAELDASRRGYGAPGALAVVIDGDERWAGPVGTADLAGTPATVAMRFRAASITKPIVATLVLDAVAEHRVGLDQEVNELLPGVLRPDPPVTIRQLLNHTSGIFDEGNEGDPVADISRIADPDLRAEAEGLLGRYLAGEDVVVADRLIVAAAETHPRYFMPGAGYHYSNVNFQVAAMVLEAVTGRPAMVALEDSVSGPLALDHTSLAPADRSSPELRGDDLPAAGGAAIDVTDDLTSFGNGGSGGLLTTPDELARIFRALLGGELLPGELLAEMKHPSRPSVANFAPYGLGLAHYELSCGTFYGHEGGVNGTVSIAMADGDARRAVVVVLNARTAENAGLPAVADRLVCGSPRG